MKTNGSGFLSALIRTITFSFTANAANWYARPSAQGANNSTGINIGGSGLAGSTVNVLRATSSDSPATSAARSDSPVTRESELRD